jgi:hypothetical protein
MPWSIRYGIGSFCHPMYMLFVSYSYVLCVLYHFAFIIILFNLFMLLYCTVLCFFFNCNLLLFYCLEVNGSIAFCVAGFRRISFLI